MALWSPVHHCKRFVMRYNQHGRFQSHAECLEQTDLFWAAELWARQRISRCGRLPSADVWLSGHFRCKVSGYQKAVLKLPFREFADQWFEGAALQAIHVPSRDTSKSRCHSRPESPSTGPTNSGGRAEEPCRIRSPTWREEWRETSTLVSGLGSPGGIMSFRDRTYKARKGHIIIFTCCEGSNFSLRVACSGHCKSTEVHKVLRVSLSEYQDGHAVGFKLIELRLYATQGGSAFT